MDNAEIVRRVLDAYMARDRATAERLIAPEFTFTSPQDEHIDRAAFFERCFPTADRFNWQRILALATVGAEDVFVLYEYELANGHRHRNAEFSTVRDGRIVETQVFFGGRVAP